MHAGMLSAEDFAADAPHASAPGPSGRVWTERGTERVSGEPRLIILADMGNEPDEEQQMTHMLVNCNEFHLVRSIVAPGQSRYGIADVGDGNGVGPYVWQPYPRDNQGQHRWAEQHIMRNHGPLGELYPYRFKGNGFLEGGGTIPWLGLVNKGLFDMSQPAWGGWSGRFTAKKQKNVWSRHGDVRADEEQYGDFFVYTEDKDAWTNPEDGVVFDVRGDSSD
jgi:hypothetical protein